MMPSLPPVYRVRQKTSSDLLRNVPGALTQAVAGSGVLGSIQAGSTIVVAVGSRGIPNYPTVVQHLTRILQGAGAEVKILPAMGSHGGGTGPGQVHLLEGLGITPGSVGAPIVDTMEVEEIGRTRSGIPVLADKTLLQADGILLANRVKDHTDFYGTIQSGLSKMIAVGFGRTRGAAVMHRYAVMHGYDTAILEMAGLCVERLPILAGIAMIDGPAGGTAHLEVVPPNAFEATEARLLEVARANALRLPLDAIDALIVDEIGKDISGTGMDTKTIGRLGTRFVRDPEKPKIVRIFVRDLTDATHGNAIGIGLADFTTRRLVEKIDMAATRLNSVTAMTPEKGHIPLTYETDREALQAMLDTVGPGDPETIRLVWIRGTNRLDELLASPAAVGGMDRSKMEIVEGPLPVAFDPDGDLIPLW